MAKELLEKIPPETCWAITAKILTTYCVLRGEKRVATEMGTGEGIISPILGAEKWHELTKRAFSEEGGRQMALRIKETFNIPEEDAIGAAKVMWVGGALFMGPEWEEEFIEVTPEKVVARYTKCPWWNRWKEQEINHDIISCYPGHQTSFEAGVKVVNPKIAYKLTKAMPWGDPYCEEVYELRDE